MKYGIKVLSGILIVGILISVFHILNDQGGSALGNIMDTLTITSIVLFLSTILFTYLSFKKNIRKISVWIFLILSCPLALMYMTNMTKELSLKITETTTPVKFVYNAQVSTAKYERDKAELQNLVDSLIKIKIVERPADLNLRYFNGKTYNDSIERDWAIDLPTKLEYKETIIDTIFYSDNGNEIVAGLLINKVFNKYMDYPNGGIEYFGNGFEFDKNDWTPFKILKYSVGGYENYKSCSDRLRYYYLKKIGTYENEYNMNDIRFLNRIE
ncbi:hypothetical protein [Algoriphagus winogradskyi]|uniref:Uncharacterized protein n=1 Tax=Algoriphagus winogradskyi TaxID=237017 RepID=A0ABY1P6N9_9BACT|nr:hypothetical protein [Algoriphagus winogradskyi]SMP26898.1 hypothetical protein SAMN06265367_1051 [Algoriphagus winogradskyi]